MNRVFKLLLITRRGPNFTPREVWSLKLQQRRNKISRERGSLAPSRQRRAGEQQTMTDGGPRDTPLYGLQVNLSVEPRGCALHEIMPGQLDRDWCVCSSPSCASVASPPALPRTFSPSPVASSAIIFAFVSLIFFRHFFVFLPHFYMVYRHRCYVFSPPRHSTPPPPLYEVDVSSFLPYPSFSPFVLIIVMVILVLLRISYYCFLLAS